MKHVTLIFLREKHTHKMAKYLRTKNNLLQHWSKTKKRYLEHQPFFQIIVCKKTVVYCAKNEDLENFVRKSVFSPLEIRSFLHKKEV